MEIQEATDLTSTVIIPNNLQRSWSIRVTSIFIQIWEFLFWFCFVFLSRNILIQILWESSNPFFLLFSLFIFDSFSQTSYKDVSSWSKYPVSLLIWRLSCQLGVSQTLKRPAGQRKGLLLKLSIFGLKLCFKQTQTKTKIERPGRL